MEIVTYDLLAIASSFQLQSKLNSYLIIRLPSSKHDQNMILGAAAHIETGTARKD